MNNKKQEARGLWIDTDGWSKRLDAIVAQTPKIDHEDVFKRMDEAIEEIKTEKPKAGTMDDLLEATCGRIVADEAREFLEQDTSDNEPSERMKRFGEALKVYEIDVTGAVLFPGYPEFCEGNGKHKGVECCCDACDFYLACFPEATPQKEEWIP